MIKEIKTFYGWELAQQMEPDLFPEINPNARKSNDPY